MWPVASSRLECELVLAEDGVEYSQRALEVTVDDVVCI